MTAVNKLSELIGNTPLIRLRQYSDKQNCSTTIMAKLESFNPLSSVKDRLGIALIEDGERRGSITKDTTIIEPTSGNTGIALAFICAERGYRLILTMPETMSIERRQLLSVFGAELVLTPGSEGMSGAIRKAGELLESIPNSCMPDQFTNPANPKIHRETTGPEILADAEGPIDYFVAGVGTGGTITGAGEFLKEHYPGIRVVAVEPEASAVLSGGTPGPHRIQGIGAGFIPTILNTEIFDEVITVSDDEAIRTARLLARAEGLLVGISSGAALFAATKLAMRDQCRGKKIVVVLPDAGERYLSTGLCDV
ncbi:MAG: cysteine synthase A [Clostridiales bacterium]|nr:cysteine synthase A [Clostridiales bacterium]